VAQSLVWIHVDRDKAFPDQGVHSEQDMALGFEWHFGEKIQLSVTDATRRETEAGGVEGRAHFVHDETFEIEQQLTHFRITVLSVATTSTSFSIFSCRSAFRKSARADSSF
jgi:hypothetical protein